MVSRADQAVALFREGFNCSQSVFATYADLFGMDRETALRVSASFGAGIGRMREVCGAASGMFLVAGLLSGATEGKDQTAKKNNYEIVQFLAAEFKKKNGGSYICRELLGLDKAVGKSIPGGVTPEVRTDEYYKKRPCPVTIHGAAEIIEYVLLDALVETDAEGKDSLISGVDYTGHILRRIAYLKQAEADQSAADAEV